ncbi:radical SAM protein [Nitrosopumilus sp. b2]|uniref:B12-binding domain-containing radical SAM protein n=1 Tax=Nitrosopumilus sp. b2 TaxID=2109908 RepID=UPI0015F64BD6|nr:radical SAM protein [Nitrosopumilus sp. b2]
MKLTVVQPPVWGNLRTPWEIAYIKSFVESNGHHKVNTVDSSISALPLITKFALEIRRKVSDSFVIETYLTSLGFLTSIAECYLIRIFYKEHVYDYRNATRALLSTKIHLDDESLEKLTDIFCTSNFFIKFDSLLKEQCNEILLKEPDYVGCTTHITSFPIALFLLKYVKELSPNTVTILSGYQASMNARDVCDRCSWVDFVIRGESEYGYLEILENKTKVRGVYNVKNVILNMDDMPPPDYSDLNMKDYKMISIMASRNCPHGICTFCQEDAFWSEFRFKNPKLLVDEMEVQYERHGINRFDFVDLDIRDFVLPFCENLKQKKHDFKWSGAMRADKKTPPLLKKMGNANCKSMFFGFESGSARILKLMQKNITLDSLSETVKEAYNNGIRSKLTCITGLPTETWDDFQRTLNFIERNSKYIPIVLVQSFKALTRSPIGVALQKPENEYGLKLRNKPELALIQDLLYSYNYEGTPEPNEVLDRHVKARRFFRDLGVGERAVLVSSNPKHKKNLLGIR